MKKIDILSRDIIFYKFDREIGFWGIPNIQKVVHYIGKYEVKYAVRHNKFGIRDDDLQIEKLRKTIVCLGGSNTWGSAVEQEDRFSNQLSKYTNRQCINLGHNSFGLDQICLTLLTKTKLFSPSIIIVEQYPWAIHRVLNTYVNGYIKPIFYLDEFGKLKLVKIPYLAHFTLFRKIVGEYRLYLKQVKEFMAGIDLDSEYDVDHDPIFLKWKSFYYDYAYLINQKIIEVMRDYCARNNLKLIFIVLPILQQFNSTSQTALIDYSLPEKRFTSILDKLDIPYLNMVKPLINKHHSESPAIQFDGHLNAKGHQIVAKYLCKELLEKNWI